MSCITILIFNRVIKTKIVQSLKMIRKSISISSLFKEVVVSEQNNEPNSTKKRCYSEEYLKRGFKCIISG